MKDVKTRYNALVSFDASRAMFFAAEDTKCANPIFHMELDRLEDPFERLPLDGLHFGMYRQMASDWRSWYNLPARTIGERVMLGAEMENFHHVVSISLDFTLPLSITFDAIDDIYKMTREVPQLLMCLMGRVVFLSTYASKAAFDVAILAIKQYQSENPDCDMQGILQAYQVGYDRWKQWRDQGFPSSQLELGPAVLAIRSL